MELGTFTEQQILDGVRRQYDEGRADVEPTADDTALIVVDMLDEFVKPGWSPLWVPEATRQVPLIRELIDAFHAADAPVIYLAYELSLKGANLRPLAHLPIGQSMGEAVGELFQRVAIYEPLAPADEDYVVLKHSYSGFHETALESVLRNLGVAKVVVSGTVTNYCCGATAREAFWRGFEVIFGSDVNSADDPALYDAELRTMRRGYARVMSSAEIVAALQGPREG